MLAIIIPYYKLLFFEATLESLANQTDKRFKVYIGDDNSPENPADLLLQYQGKFEFVYQRFDNNLGGTALTKQWDRCIELSVDEEWLMILGDDDVLGDNVVEAFYNHMPDFESKINLVRFASKQINEKTKIDSKIFIHPVWEKATDFYIKKQKGLVRSSLSECIFKRVVYNKFGFKNYPLAWHSDDLAWIEFAEGKLVYSINEALVSFRMSHNNISGQNSNFKEKANAEFNFRSDLLNQKFHYFNKNQKLILLMYFEYFLKNNRKMLLHEWIILFEKYLTIKSIVPLLKFIRRFILYYLKPNDNPIVNYSKIFYVKN